MINSQSVYLEDRCLIPWTSYSIQTGAELWKTAANIDPYLEKKYIISASIVKHKHVDLNIVQVFILSRFLNGLWTLHQNIAEPIDSLIFLSYLNTWNINRYQCPTSCNCWCSSSVWGVSPSRGLACSGYWSAACWTRVSWCSARGTAGWRFSFPGVRSQPAAESGHWSPPKWHQQYCSYSERYILYLIIYSGVKYST